MVLPAERADAGQGFPIPDFSDGVVGIAQQHQRRLGICQLPLQVLKIDPVRPSVVNKSTLQGLAAVIQDGIEKNVVHRRHQKHLFRRRGELSHHTGNGRHHPGTENQPLRLHGEAVAIPPPADIGLIPFLRHDGIAKNPMLRSGPDSLPNTRGSLEIHIGNPHGKLTLCHIPLQRAGVPSVHQTVKIPFHAASSPTAVKRRDSGSSGTIPWGTEFPFSTDPPYPPEGSAPRSPPPG